MEAIIAINAVGAIGLNGELPWPRHTADMQLFRKLTDGKHMVAGRTTAEGLKHLNLGNRKLTTFSRERGWCWELFAESTPNVIVVGGRQTYRHFAQFIKHWYVSVLPDKTEGDTYMPLDEILTIAEAYKAKVTITYF